MKEKSVPIDFIITWVDNNDITWLEEKQKYLESMLKVIEIRSKKEDIGSIKKFIETIKKLISKNDKKEKMLSKKQ